jgi:Protein of unknown function (DUF3105)
LGNKRSGQVSTTASSGSNRTYIIVGAVIAVFVAGFAALVILDARQQSGSAPPGDVQTYDVGPAGQHTPSDVDYAQTPPAGGEHNDVWQNEGYYEEPVRDENAVHTLEHGAVWITYSPDLPQEQRDQIRELVEGQTCMLASPHPDLPSPVVASAWGKQLTLESADDPTLDQFIRAYRQGPQTPEPGAACTGGTADTV